MHKAVLCASLLVLSVTVACSKRPTVTEEEHRQLLARVEQLATEVERLRRIAPDFTTFMPEVAERFHILHFGGERGDWALAQHEFESLNRLASIAPDIAPEFGKIFLEGYWPSIQAQIEQGISSKDRKVFLRSLDQATELCNSCHAATNSSVVVTLEPQSPFTLRHPHRTTMTGDVTPHKHKH